MSKVRPTKVQMRVFVLIDNTMSVNHESAGVIHRMQDRGWLDGTRITRQGYEVFDKHRNGRSAAAK